MFALQAAVDKISCHKTGLSTIASCITSSHMKSRIVAIELLTVVCRAPEFGNSRVLEAMTTVRILFGESVRFKFLVSVLNSNITSTSGLEVRIGSHLLICNSDCLNLN
ncbi:uncharacterized protein CEXT_218681 [Caerostris extrusa]|uniref:Uncharacterized protein n=1 Tax=Caerostris extrusa TaxID=172846 RepID=A0AAV4MJ26_CAEEX|nr:uncharacterized protein CEXT_218681 [Caerostris extrusa]